MRIGIAFDLKDESAVPADRPDDWQEEFDSPVTVAAIASVLRDLGHDVTELGDGRELLSRLLADPPDLVFNLAEGHGTSRSREARVPAVCEMLGVPCTGSDPLTLAVALDKGTASQLVGSAGVPTPRSFVLPPGQSPTAALARREGFPFPALVKPAWEGSSKGIRSKCLVESRDDFAEVAGGLQRDYGQPLLVEEFIAGDELTVGLLGPTDAPRVLGVMLIRPRRATARFVYSLEVKRDYLRQVEYFAPPPLPTAVLAEVERRARRAYQALGCRDVARLDFRLDGDEPIFLEANPLAGLNPESSDLVIMAGLLGLSHAQLVAMVLAETLARLPATGEPGC